MSDSSSKAVLFRKIAAVAGAVGAIEKDGQNKDKGYRYATPAGVFAAVKPPMAAQQLAIVPHLVEVTEKETGQTSGRGTAFLMTYVKMHYHILDGETGETLVVPWEAQAGTWGDDKGIAKAQTIALRTFLIQLFQIPAEDPELDPDAGDARRPGHAHPQQSSRQAAPIPAQRQATAPAPSAPPINRQTLLERIAALTAEAEQLGLEIELKKPITQFTNDELIEHGKRVRAAVDAERAAVELAGAR